MIDRQEWSRRLAGLAIAGGALWAFIALTGVRTFEEFFLTAAFVQNHAEREPPSYWLNGLLLLVFVGAFMAFSKRD